MSLCPHPSNEFESHADCLELHLKAARMTMSVLVWMTVDTFIIFRIGKAYCLNTSMALQKDIMLALPAGR